MLKCLSLPSLSSIVSKTNNVSEWSIFRCSIPERPLGLVLHKQKTRPKRMPGTNTQHKYYGCKNCYNIESSFQSFELPKNRIYHHRLHKKRLVNFVDPKTGRIWFQCNTFHFGRGWCFLPWIMLTMFAIFKAGPSFMSMYFIIMSVVSSSRALPSISWFRKSCRHNLIKLFCFCHSCRTKKTTVFPPHHFIWRLFYKTFYGCN